MGNRVILRLVKKKLTPLGEVEVEYTGLFGRESWRVEVYRVEPDYLVLQTPDKPDAFKGEASIVRVAPPPWRRFCRWHDGPLWEKDEPWKRIYCVVEAESYCRQHKRSLRALYEFCLGTNSPNALELCKKIDSMGRTNYVVYLTDAGAGRVKVGVTREFRFLERLSEQAHNAATMLHVTDSLYEARRLELEVSRRNLASQVKSRKPKSVPLSKVAPLLAGAAERISREMGLDWNGRLVRVVSDKQSIVLNAREAKRDHVEGRKFRIVGYWGGHLILEGEEGRITHISDRVLIHSDSLIVGEE